MQQDNNRNSEKQNVWNISYTFSLVLFLVTNNKELIKHESCKKESKNIQDFLTIAVVKAHCFMILLGIL